MKILLKSEHVFGMANLSPKRSGLSVNIWSDGSGILRTVSHSETPRVKIGYLDGRGVSVTIEAEPEIKAQSQDIKKSEMNAIEEGIKYVSRNYDLFLKHYMDTDGSYDDDDLTDELRARGEYR